MAAAKKTRSFVHGEYPFYFELVQVGDCFRDLSYQREDTHWVEKIRANFRPELIGSLDLSERTLDGRRAERRFAVLDGGNRRKALHMLGVRSVWGKIWTGLTVKQEALLFDDLNRLKGQTTSWDSFRARLVGETEETVSIQRILAAHGRAVGPHSGLRVYGAVRAVEDVHARQGRYTGPECLEICQTMLDQWDSMTGATDGNLLRGLGKFVQEHESFDPDKLAKKMSEVGPQWIINEASKLGHGYNRGGAGAEGHVMQAFQKLYRSRGAYDLAQ